jgi:hypothetical protein
MIGPMIAILLGAAAAPAAYAGFEPLKGAGKDTPLCTTDASICVDVSDPGVLTIARDGKDIANWSPDTDSGDLSLAPMPALFRLRDGRLLVGVLATRQSSYSGGGGSATEHMLALVEPGKESKLVLRVPEGGSLMIRACFDEKDFKHRAGACHDEYRFDGALAIAPSAADGPPTLRFKMTASHYPRGVSREGDSLTLPPLRKADLTWQDDPRCTYRRVFRFDAASAQYLPDAALPECSDYTVP